MSDLIDRKEAVEAIKNEMLSWLEGDSHDYRKVVDAIMDLPTLDAIPLEFIKARMEGYYKNSYTELGACLETLIEDWRKDNGESN